MQRLRGFTRIFTVSSIASLAIKWIFPNIFVNKYNQYSGIQVTKTKRDDVMNCASATFRSKLEFKKLD